MMRKYKGKKVEIRSIVDEPEIEEEPDEIFDVTPDDYEDLAKFLDSIGIGKGAEILRSTEEKK
jgi:hypothetical protein